ncbi:MULTISPECIES: aminotransferase class III-fold pyridoxal phosphate-dependent enzyme [unclassified Photorhabdus]|uniref:aminotransferase class III-fold pyridoxal phosphate-dependent enzyme n=1 Tax=unclassified Photorhabdus TaxID=2620880 RepID=UPI00186466F9|nr:MULTISPECIES: aminotransferase class III-fold pyridoxal phosphate-dependent enzyme [unclassified Photorhabdus]
MKKLVNHPLLIAMNEERITLSGMRYFLIQHHHYSRNFTRFLCALISHIDNFNDIHHLMENLREEMGINGEGKVTHAELFQRSLMEIGAQVSSVPILEETSYFASCVLNYCRSGEIADGLAALCLGAEAIVPMIYKPVLHALIHLGIAERGFQFTGPTGTNAVEAAMKIARKMTGRSDIVAFTNAFYGMSLGALAATAREKKRNAAGVSLNNIVRLPFENFLGQNDTSLDILEKMLVSPGSGIDLPAAIILETIQAEGGVNVASVEWLRSVAEIAAANNILLIVDDIQAGCGRTGTFFSFEEAGIKPDIICLAKSVSGYGLPMSLVLMKPGELEQVFDVQSYKTHKVTG